MTKTGIILLSGGLDSLVSLDIAIKQIEIKLALFFDYGQKAFLEEKEAVVDICNHYNIFFEEIELPFLKQVTANALVDVSNNNLDEFKNVWIPNRNGLFLNIAGVYADKFEIDYIIFGANSEEANKFSDNSVDFIKSADKFFKYSTQKHPKIFAPCLEFDKIQILDYAINNDVPLNKLKSCYDSKGISGKRHCGKCMSCKYLKNAILKSQKPELLKELF